MARPGPRRRTLPALAALVAAAVAATACSAAAAPVAPARSATRAATVHPYPANAVFDYQIGGAYAPARTVRVVDRDRHDAPVAGRYNVCYVNAFQTQPEDLAWWRARHPDLLLRTAGGQVVMDPDWPGEALLDTSTAARRAGVLRVVGPWLDGCARSGYQAVEPDNLDSWTRSRGRLTRAANVAMATAYAGRAHRAGLAMAQKNAPELTAADRRAVGFDFAVAEECQVYDECGAYTRTYGTRLVEVEYTDNGRTAYTTACRLRGATTTVLLRDRDVTPKGDPAHRSRSC